MAQKIGFLKKANEPTELERTEQNIAQVEGEIQQRVYQLGQLFYEENKANENVDSKYYSLVDTIAKLELNRMGFYKNKLRLQGIAVQSFPTGVFSAAPAGKGQTNGKQETLQ